MANLQIARDNSIKDINNQLNEAQLQYAIKESELLSDIENAKLELQKYGNELAYKKYQDALTNYMNFANYDYNKTINERDYNYKLSRDKVADEQWQKEYDFALQQYKDSKKKSSSSGSRGGSITGAFTGNDDIINNNTIQEATLSDSGQKLLQTIQKGQSMNGGIVGNYVSKQFNNKNNLRNYIYNQVGNTISENDAEILFNKLGL